SRRCAQSNVLPDRVDCLPRASDKPPEIPNPSSAAARRTNAANMYVPIKFLFIERMPTNKIVSAPIRRDMKDVALCACEKSHQIPIKNPAINRSSFRLQVFRSVCQVCSKCQKKKKPRIRQSAPNMFLVPAIPLLDAPPPQGSNSRPH